MDVDGMNRVEKEFRIDLAGFWYTREATDLCSPIQSFPYLQARNNFYELGNGDLLVDQTQDSAITRSGTLSLNQVQNTRLYKDVSKNTK
jgi:hypothetical protein